MTKDKADLTKCGKCKKKLAKKPELDSEQSIECDCCVLFFHIDCVDVSNDKLNAVTSNNLYWYCPSCEFAASKLKQHCASLQAGQDKLRKELNTLKDQYEKLKKKVEDNENTISEKDTKIHNLTEKVNNLETSVTTVQLSCIPLTKMSEDIEELKKNKPTQPQPLLTEIVSKSGATGVEGIRSIISEEFEEKKKLDDESKLREKKKNNLIVFNMPELEDASDNEELMRNDFDKIKQIYEGRAKLRERDLVNITRLGNKNQDKIRPILLVFKDEDVRTKILRNNRDLKYMENNVSSSIYVHIDRTPKQRQTEKVLREELNRRKNSGEKNIVIRNEQIVPFRAAAQKPWASMFD